MVIFPSGRRLFLLLMLPLLLGGCATSAEPSTSGEPRVSPEKSLGEALSRELPVAGQTPARAPFGRFDIHKRHGLGRWEKSPTPSGGAG